MVGSAGDLLKAARPGPLAALGLSAAFGITAFGIAYASRRHRSAALAEGPFFALVAEPNALSQWLVARSSAQAVAASVVLGAVVTMIGPLQGVATCAAALVGVAGGAVVALAAPTPVPSTTTAVPRDLRSRRPGPAWMLPALVTVRVGRRSAAVLAISATALGATATAFAVRNNEGPAFGYALAVSAASLTGAALLPRGRLPAFLGREPVGLFALYARLCWPVLAASAASGITCGLIGGLGVAGALETSIGAFTVLLVFSWFVFLHRMIRSERNTPLSVTMEVACAAIMAAVQLSLGPIWLGARGLILIRAAQRRRWLDR